MINFSIIIPHKNCQDLLVRCLKSIPAREDIEVIVVDDNSGIANFKNQILKLFPNLNIHIICLNEPRYAGGARNEGLKIANGKWLVFADADDFFTSNAFEIMDTYINTDTDIVYFAHKAVFSDNLEPTERLGNRLRYINEYVDKHSPKSEDYLKYMNHSPAAKIIKRDLVLSHNLYFDEVPAGNDAIFSVSTSSYAKNIEVDKRAVYCATIRRGSITQTKNKTNAFSRYCVDLRLYKFFRERHLYHLYPFVTMRIVNALRYYGIAEFCKYLKLAYKYKVNIFLGITRRFNKKYQY